MKNWQSQWIRKLLRGTRTGNLMHHDVLRKPNYPKNDRDRQYGIRHLVPVVFRDECDNRKGHEVEIESHPAVAEADDTWSRREEAEYTANRIVANLIIGVIRSSAPNVNERQPEQAVAEQQCLGKIHERQERDCGRKQAGISRRSAKSKRRSRRSSQTPARCSRARRKMKSAGGNRVDDNVDHRPSAHLLARERVKRVEQRDRQE